MSHFWQILARAKVNKLVNEEKSLSDIDHRSMRTGDHSLSTSARTITK